MNWGTNLTMIGAIRLRGLVTMGTMFKTMNGDRFVGWVSRRLVPNLYRGDVVVMDNARAHHDPRVRPIIERCGARLLYLPPYSPDLNPIEPAWALIKKEIKRNAPRTPIALRRVAHNARRKVHAAHCLGWFEHAGYVPIRK
jgi:transposase